MQNRNPYQNYRQEPRVIALAATKPNRFATLAWQTGVSFLAYSWLSFLLK